MKILITGASGFIGSAVATALETAGHQVTRLSLRATTHDSPFTIHRQESLDAVVHCGWAGVRAADRDDGLVQAENLEVLNRLMAYCRVNPPEVFIAFGSQAELYQAETAYGRAKLACRKTLEYTGKELAMRLVWLRLFSVYGPGESAGWLIPSLTRKLLRHEPIALTPGEQEMDYMHVTDVASAVLAAIKSNAAGVYDVGSGQPIKLKDLVWKLHALTASRSALEFGALSYRDGQVMRACAAPHLFTEDTAWRPEVSMDEGLRSVVEKLKSLE